MNNREMTPTAQAARRPIERLGAVDIYRHYLSEVLAEVLETTAPMAPGLERLCAGMEAYWEACYTRRHARLRVMREINSPGTDQVLLRLSRPFGYLLHSELEHGGCANALTQAWVLFAELRGIAQDEARSGKRHLHQRAQLQRRIRERIAGGVPTKQ
ncbi:MAG TPA: hypothetical protein VLI06_01365 [Solimonas sp.]|nr:hypothetical protein [Solimonas sp.]